MVGTWYVVGEWIWVSPSSPNPHTSPRIFSFSQNPQLRLLSIWPRNNTGQDKTLPLINFIYLSPMKSEQYSQTKSMASKRSHGIRKNLEPRWETRIHSTNLAILIVFFFSGMGSSPVSFSENYWILREYHKCVFSTLTWIVSPTINLINETNSYMREENTHLWHSGSTQ